VHSLVVIGRYVNAVLFVLLALMAVQHWRRRRSVESRWAAASLGMMAVVAGIGYFLPADVDSGPLTWVQKTLVVLLALFPYSLYRFSAAFELPGRRIERVAAGLTAAVVLLTLALPRFPAPGERWPSWFGGYVAVLLFQWATLSTLTAVRLWRGGADKPTVSRRRMRTLSVASALMILALLLAAMANGAYQETTAIFFVQLLAMGSAALFFAGFAPPRPLRKVWRRPEENVLQKAELGLMAATTPQEVTAQVLPHVAGVLGGWGAALVDEAGNLLGTHGVDPDLVAAGLRGSGEQHIVKLPMRSGALFIWTSAYTPFFGKEELALLESFNVMVDLALARCESIDAQRIAAENLAQANDELARARDAAMESSRLKSEFLATMSHEIRTPMNGVIGLTGLLLKTTLDERQREYAEGVRGAGESLLAIINDILDYSKIEADRVELETVDFNLPELLGDAAHLFTETAASKGLDMQTVVPDGMPADLRGDPARLRQVLINLISNAIKFTQHGKVTVRAELAGEKAGGVIVRFEVEDTGIGIAQEDRDKLFEPFSQADSSTTRRFGGTGLGLAISRRLVALMGGTIGLESEPGRGSTFWFVLPLAWAAEAASKQGVPAITDNGGSPGRLTAAAGGSRGRVLVVEDDKVSQLVATAILEQLGFSADVAENGSDALESIARAAYSAVLMDCQMPEMDGYTATRRIRLREGSSGHTPVIAMTAAAMEGDRERCLEAGMDDYISKPIRPEDVEAALARWVDPALTKAPG